MIRTKLKRAVAVWIILGSIAAYGGEAWQPMIKREAVPVYQPKAYPFETGEQEVYRASWNGMVSVATAEVQTVPTVIDGKKVFQVRVEAKTSRALDLIWKTRDAISSTFDAKALTPSRF